MNKIRLLYSALWMPFIAMAQVLPAETPVYYGPGLCASSLYECVKVNSGQSWANLFPNEQQRDLVQRLNRSYNSLWPGRVIAVPRDLAHATLIGLAPFPQTIDADHEKQVIVDQDKLAWGAYDAEGQLVNWGPIASGRDKCPDSNNTCRTLTGIFRVFSKENSKCKSDIFPIGKGGAKMPYCMYFHKGFALHGSDDIPGYRASHGCVRMFTQDAKWLNEVFVDASNPQNNFMGTIVVVRPVTSSGKMLPASKEDLAAKPSRDVSTASGIGNAWVDPDRFPPTITEKRR